MSSELTAWERVRKEVNTVLDVSVAIPIFEILRNIGHIPWGIVWGWVLLRTVISVLLLTISHKPCEVTRT